MRRPISALAVSLALPFALSACGDPGATWPVRATLEDGQVLMGAVQTPMLVLEGGLGTLSIPWEDVGEVEPVEGEGLAESGGYVDIWLRNGSELTGHWADAALAMDLAVGGQEVAVDVPANELLRLQTQGGEVWPQGVVYRVRTSHGDDFLVDPEASNLVIENEMGTFAPFLSECVSAAPLKDPDGDWRIELQSGTVLIGPLVHDAITFELDLGPEQATVPLDSLVSLERQDWGTYHREDEGRSSGRLLSGLRRSLAPQVLQAPKVSPDVYEPTAAAAYPTVPETADAIESLGNARDTGGQVVAGSDSSLDEPVQGWFDNRALRDLKRSF